MGQPQGRKRALFSPNKAIDIGQEWILTYIKEMGRMASFQMGVE